MSLKSLILARTLTGTALADMFALAFSADSLKFVTSRSDQEINDAIAALPATKGANPRITGKMYIALGAAIGAGMKTIRSELGDGGAWDGNILGSFAKAKAEKRAPYLAAHALGVAVFRDTLATADGWMDAAEKSAEQKKTEKDARDAEKARKAAEEKARIKSELIAEGELVSVDSIKSLGKASAGELVSALLTMDIDDETAATLTAMLSARQKAIKAAEKAAEKAAALLAAAEVASFERAAARELDLAEKPATHATEKTVVGDVYADAAPF